MDGIQLNINLSFQQLVEAVKQLSPSEKLKLNDAIWDDSMSIPLEHQELVIERITKSKKNPARMIDWEKAVKSLKS